MPSTGAARGGREIHALHGRWLATASASIDVDSSRVQGLVAELADGVRGRLRPRPAAEQGGALRAEMLAREFQGPSAEYTVACGGLELTMRGAPELALRADSRARLEVLGRAGVLEDRPD